jgi:hypothetical protein
MILVGDIHGSFKRAFEPAKANPSETVIQVGDFGVFNAMDFTFVNQFRPPNLHFFAGNHDNRRIMEQMPGYLKSGWHEELGVFVVNGAYSVDYVRRYPGWDWFDYEEHSDEEFDQLLSEYFRIKPKIILSHDGPYEFVRFVLIGDLKLGDSYGNLPPSKTQLRLQQLLDVHRPDSWYFGHWHQSVKREFLGVDFNVLGMNEVKAI